MKVLLVRINNGLAEVVWREVGWNLVIDTVLCSHRIASFNDGKKWANKWFPGLEVKSEFSF